MHHHILRFVLLRALITILLVGGLGVLDQKNDFRESSIIFRVTYVKLDEKEFCLQKQGTLRKWNENVEIFCSCFS
jgi:hypothetical protein